MGPQSVHWLVGLVNRVFSRSRLLLLICSWLGSAEAARPSTVDHVQLSETDPSYFAEVLDSAIGMFKAVGTAIQREHHAEEMKTDVFAAVAATTSTTRLTSGQSETDAAEICTLGDGGPNPSGMVKALQACIQSLEDLAAKTKDHSKKSRDTDDAYASAYTKADEMLRGMEDRKRAVMSYASDQNMAYCALNLRLCRIQNDFVSLDGRGGQKTCETVENCVLKLDNGMNVSVPRVSNAATTTTPGAENKTTSTASAGVMNTTTAGINTTGVFTTTSPTTTVRIAKTTTSTTAALKVVERSTKLSKPSTSGSGHHLLDEVDRGLRERGISISHETFRVTLMWDEDVDIDLQLLVAHEQGHDVVKKDAVYWGHTTYGPFKLDVDDRALTTYSKHMESIGVESDHARLPDGDYLIIANYFSGTPLLGSDKKPIRSIECGSDGKPHMCVDKSFVPQVVYHAVMSFRTHRDGAYTMMPRNSASCPPGREVKDAAECLTAINGLTHRQWKHIRAPTSHGPRYCSVDNGMQPQFAPELEHVQYVQGSKSVAPVCKSTDVAQALVSKGMLAFFGETQVLFHFRVKDSKIVTLLTAPCGFNGIPCQEQPPVTTPVHSGGKRETV